MAEVQTLTPEPAEVLPAEPPVYVPNPTSIGGHWAQWNVELSKKYGGCWMVVIPGEVISYGQDFDVVAEEGARKLGMPISEIVVTAISHPKNWRFEL